MSVRTLVLVRHSKAAHDAPTDLERSLTAKGQRMAVDLARALNQRLDGLDSLLVSPAARARETARPIADRLTPADVRVETAIYHSGPQGILRLLTSLVPAVSTVTVVGHEPTISILAHALHDDRADDLAAQVSFGVPTATALLLDVPTSWERLTYQHAHLREIVTVPR